MQVASYRLQDAGRKLQEASLMKIISKEEEIKEGMGKVRFR